MNGIGDDYINSAIDELTAQLGVKDAIAIKTILKPLRAGNLKECTENIAQYLGLPVTVNLSNAPFESTGLANTDDAGRGVAGITAQVSIPSYLPFYGTPGLQGFPISVRISDNCLRHPVTFAAVMAHELSHIVLHSLVHREKDNEFYADLTAMVLGFSRIMKDGREVRETQTVLQQNYIIYSRTITQTTTTTYGYLSDRQFELAFRRIQRILRTYKASCRGPRKELKKELSDYEKTIAVYKQQLFRFSEFMDRVDKKHITRMSQDDARKLIAFHQPGYLDRFAGILKSNEEKCRQIHDRLPADLLEGIGSCYTTRMSDSLRTQCNDVGAALSNLEKESVLLKNDVATLKKYAGLLARL